MKETIIEFIQTFSKPKHGNLNAIKLCKVIVRNQETNKKFVVSDARWKTGNICMWTVKLID